MMVSLQLQTIETRGLVVAMSDQVRIAEHLIDADDSSFTMRNTGIQLLRGAAAEAISCYSSQSSLLAAAASGLQTSPSLHVEVRLQQVLAWVLAEYALSASQTISPHHMSSSDALRRFPASLDVAIDVSKHFPATNKPFLASAVALQGVLSSISRGEAFSLPSIDYSGVRKVEKQYRGYSRAVGSGLAVCRVGHPYFEAVFGEGKCPVCGTRVLLDDEEFRAASEHLFEDKFLAAMKRRSE